MTAGRFHDMQDFQYKIVPGNSVSHMVTNVGDKTLGRWCLLPSDFIIK